MLRFAQHDIDGIGRTCDTGADGVLSTFSLRLYRAEIFVLLEIKVLPQESLKNQNSELAVTLSTPATGGFRQEETEITEMDLKKLRFPPVFSCLTESACIYYSEKHLS